MTRTFLPLAAALAVLATSPASAQRSAALCQDLAEARELDENLPDPAVDMVPCTNLEGRLYAQSDTHGLEEDAIIGVGSADVTLDHGALGDLEATRVVLVPAPGAGKFLFVDWVVVVKTGADAITPVGSFVGLGVAVAPQAGDVYDEIPVVSVTGSGFGAGVFDVDGTFIRRFRPSRIGVGVTSVEDTPIVAVVTSDAAPWNSAVAQLDATAEVRFIVRYRVIDTSDTF